MSDDRLTVISGDCLEELRRLPAESVHLCVTSPPYWGLRDYKIPPSVWGGDPACEHEFVDQTVTGTIRTGEGLAEWSASHARGGGHKSGQVPIIYAVHGFCSKCNAWRGVFGLEPTPELYLEHSVLIFREVWRVLRKDGTLWVNLGDSYSNNSKWGGTSGNKNSTSAGGGYQGQRVKRGNRPSVNGHGSSQASGPDYSMGPNQDAARRVGDLVGIPWRVALALQADGWFLRRDNIWFKPNPMPESVNGWRWEQHRVKVVRSRRYNGGKQAGRAGTSAQGSTLHRAVQEGREAGAAEFSDCPGCSKCESNGGLILRKGNWRCTTSHEYVFQFSKSDSYFCDAEAARERATGGAHPRGNGVNPKAAGKNSRMAVDRDPAHTTTSRVRAKQNASWSAAVRGITGNRNRRSVWTIPTAPFKGAHFATFPPALVRPIIKAASPVKCCSECGAPWAPIVQRGEPREAQQRACGGDASGKYNGTATKDFIGSGAEDASAVKARILAGMVTKTVIGFRPTCKHAATAGIPATVLDLFGGSGMVGQVALEEGRAAVLIELSREYLPMIHKRCSVTHGLAL